jgi:WD40 repeat protein
MASYGKQSQGKKEMPTPLEWAQTPLSFSKEKEYIVSDLGNAPVAQVPAAALEIQPQFAALLQKYRAEKLRASRTGRVTNALKNLRERRGARNLRSTQNRRLHAHLANTADQLAFRPFHLAPLEREVYVPKKRDTVFQRPKIPDDAVLLEDSANIRRDSILDKRSMFTDSQAQTQSEPGKYVRKQTNVDRSILDFVDHRRLDKIRAEFFGDKDQEIKLTLEQFVEVLTMYLPMDSNSMDEVKFASLLCKFFANVDINGDDSLTWKEFCDYIIDTGIQSHEALSDVFDLYQKSDVEDYQVYTGVIEKLTYLERLDHLLIFEHERPWFRVTNADDLSVVEEKIDGHTSDLIAAEYLSSRRWVATCANDRTIRLWDPFDHYSKVKNCETISTDYTQQVLRYSESFDILFSADGEQEVTKARGDSRPLSMKIDGASGAHPKGGITAWKFQHLKHNNNKYTAEPTQVYTGVHTDTVMDLMVLQNIGKLASAGMDRRIVLWDLADTGDATQAAVTLEHKEKGHQRGVFALAYHEDFHCLVSAGFEHHALVWNPYSKEKKPNNYLKGHYHSLIGVQAVPQTFKIITADRGAVIKVWDVRTFGCVQTLHIEDGKGARVSRISSIAQVHPHKRIISASAKLHVHDSLFSASHHEPLIADFEPSSVALFNTYCPSFITASGCKLKFWASEDGSLQRVHSAVSADITALVLDELQKKIIIGDQQGRVRVFNYLNGRCLKTSSEKPLQALDRVTGAVMGRHRCEVTSVAYFGEQKQILATISDGSLCVFDESKDESLPLIKRVSHHGSEIVSSAMSSLLTLLATGESAGHVALWDFRSQHTVGQLLRGHKHPVTALAFLEPFPLLASADNAGHIIVWALRPILLNAGKCLLRLLNPSRAPLPANTTRAPDAGSTVTCMVAWQTQSRFFLYTGDVDGFVKVWDLTSALARWGLEPFRGQPRESNSNGVKEAESYRRAHEAQIAALEEAGRTSTSILQKGDVTLVKQWRAHNDAIRSMKLVNDPISVIRGFVTTSFDKKVCVWDGAGNSLGHLQQGRTASSNSLMPPWVFVPDNAGRKLAARNQARVVLEKMHTSKANRAVTKVPLDRAHRRLVGAGSQSARFLTERDDSDSEGSDSGPTLASEPLKPVTKSKSKHRPKPPPHSSRLHHTSRGRAGQGLADSLRQNMTNVFLTQHAEDDGEAGLDSKCAAGQRQSNAAFERQRVYNAVSFLETPRKYHSSLISSPFILAAKAKAPGTQKAKNDVDLVSAAADIIQNEVSDGESISATNTFSKAGALESRQFSRVETRPGTVH